jgi:hypothetical protein
MGTLGAGVLVPNVLRWYWWRINGWGYAWGAFSGMALSLLQVLVAPDVALYVSFPVIVGLVGTITVVASLCTAPTEASSMRHFCQTTRPWGFWRGAESAPWRDIGNICLGVPFMASLYLGAMYVILHDAASALWCLATAAVTAVTLYFTWYKRLPLSGQR